jgi:uncharacterized membrane protein YcaP (DUF421 family)
MIDSEMFFGGWERVARVAVLTVIGYAALLVMLRLSRKRSLAKMNVFDFIYVVIVGELLAITIMDHNVSLAEGVVAVAILIGLQVLLSWLTTRSTKVERVINGEPTLLMYRGRFLHDAMHAQRTTEREILAAVRNEGVADLAEVEAVVMETNGSFSVVHGGEPSKVSTLRDVPEVDDARDREEHRGERRTARHERRRPAGRAEAATR